RRSEVSGPGDCARPGLVHDDLYDPPATIPGLVERRIAERVLPAQILADLLVDAGKLAGSFGIEESTSGLFGQRADNVHERAALFKIGLLVEPGPQSD